MPDYPKALGFLMVAVTTARGTLPLPGALVTVYAQDDGKPVLYRTVRTDISGRTPIIELPAPALEGSLSPDQPLPYLNYSVKVNLPDYQSAEVRDISIFSGIASTLPIPLSPETTGRPSTSVNILPPGSLNAPDVKEEC